MKEELQETKMELLSTMQELKQAKATILDDQDPNIDRRCTTDIREADLPPRNQYPRQLHSPEPPLRSEYEARRTYRDPSPPSQSLYQADTNQRRTKRPEDGDQPSRRLDDQKMEPQSQPERRGQATAANRWDNDERSRPAHHQNAQKWHEHYAVSLDSLSKISRKQEAGCRKQKAGCSKQAAVNRLQETGCSKQADRKSVV